MFREGITPMSYFQLPHPITVVQLWPGVNSTWPCITSPDLHFPFQNSLAREWPHGDLLSTPGDRQISWTTLYPWGWSQWINEFLFHLQGRHLWEEFPNISGQLQWDRAAVTFSDLPSFRPPSFPSLSMVSQYKIYSLWNFLVFQFGIYM